MPTQRPRIIPDRIYLEHSVRIAGSMEEVIRSLQERHRTNRQEIMNGYFPSTEPGSLHAYVDQIVREQEDPNMRQAQVYNFVVQRSKRKTTRGSRGTKTPEDRPEW